MQMTRLTRGWFKMSINNIWFDKLLYKSKDSGTLLLSQNKWVDNGIRIP